GCQVDSNINTSCPGRLFRLACSICFVTYCGPCACTHSLDKAPVRIPAEKIAPQAKACRIFFSSRSIREFEGHSTAADPAVTARILRQVLLVILLGVVELRRLANLGGDLRAMCPAQCFLVAPLAVLGRLL